ncbi:MAG: LamG domain-containing protein, partial [Chitinophagaceae bacterium]|nr:LamG domain-containing protein [Chitinophagaceae bacterium]
AQVTNGLVAKYSFFGNANDEIGTNHGTVNGATLVADRFGIPNRAYKFDGFNGNSINLGNSNTLKPSTCSISLWAYIDSTACYQSAFNYQPFILTTNTSAPNAYYEAYSMGYYIAQPKLLSINYQSGAATGTECFSQNNIITKRWYHLVFSFDNDSMSTYLDNVQLCSIPKAFTTTYDNGNVMLGKSTVVSKDAYLNGRLDDIRIYNRRLTAAEVDTLYHLQAASPEAVANIDLYNQASVYQQAGNLHVEANANIESIKMLNMSGCLVQTYIPNTLQVYPLGNLAKGLYLCEVRLANKQRTVAKVVVN